jgi:hypothetical protein
METKSFFINGYWIWALTFEAAMKHYELIMKVKQLEALN